jgi:transposase-like protein
VWINGETYYLWRAVDHEGEVLEVFAPVEDAWAACFSS